MCAACIDRILLVVRDCCDISANQAWQSGAVQAGASRKKREDIQAIQIPHNDR